jgi:hypothetical protein
MTNWFDPILLVRTAIRAAVSAVFGSSPTAARRSRPSTQSRPRRTTLRSTIQARRAIFWFDDMADIGDG